MSLIKVAPGVFVSSWEEVECGYLHGKQKLQQFVIRLKSSHTIAIQGQSEISETLEIWRNSVNSPLTGLEKSSQIPAEIAFWLPTASTQTIGKKAARYTPSHQG